MNLERFNLLNDEQAFEALKPCVQIPSWIESIVLQRPFGSAEELYQAAALQARIWQWSEILEALAQHPRIGEKKSCHDINGKRAAVFTKRTGSAWCRSRYSTSTLSGQFSL